MYRYAVCLVLGVYACARILQVVTGPAPRLSLVAMDVLAALAFALVDGSRNYGFRGIVTFAAICAVIGNLIENLGVANGIPFGRYVFTKVMGPWLFNVPILLGLAYVGMAYVSWILARAILANIRPEWRVLAVPALASFIMTAWDLAQDPVWSTMLHAWVWRDGGLWLGVPLSNFLGWYLTDFLIYLTFATLAKPLSLPADKTNAWPSVAFYLLCAGGNVLQLAVHRNVEFAIDGSGSVWRIRDILAASAAVSVFVMGSIAAAAAARSIRWPQTVAAESATD